jgi:DNA repair photolyase
MKSLSRRQKVVKKQRAGHGTQEWSVKTINCCTGCSHDCRYCYAKGMATRFKQVTKGNWPNEKIRPHHVKEKHKNYGGQVMFPSSHDITPNNFDACKKVLKNLLEVGNKVLVVSKPHLECIEQICSEFQDYKEQIIFRFTIGACDDSLLSYWEPNAPGYSERKASLKHTYERGFKTSVSVEPMLDSANIDALISDLSPYVTHSIWVGKMNHIGRFAKGGDQDLQREVDRIRQGQADAKIKEIYDRHRNNSKIRWKKEIKKVVGIPIPEENGLDI